MTDISRLSEQFDEAMFDIYRRAKSEAHYTATIFLGMLNAERGLMTARKLINAPKESDGYTALWLKKRLDLTVEAVVLENEKWHQLFTPEEIEKCKTRLHRCGYISKQHTSTEDSI
ncbi:MULTISPECIES: hypothetical protein [Acidobacteriaceae]|uniref:hypothetical protein n=1 Tax=Acidobacteriaceae TaxID=204434 RepID=UPI00131C26C0|nr:MULTISPECIES: hypothetical protein [Acidobacteriaceae]MDW5267183.1 hypothetical protein [Edaphobacter sp.]